MNTRHLVSKAAAMNSIAENTVAVLKLLPRAMLILMLLVLLS